MPRRAAQVLQADVARVIRAAKQAGASEVVVPVGGQSVIVRLVPSVDVAKTVPPTDDVVL
jgi:hypothetical protein